MSELTVKDCFSMFPDMKLKDMEKLMGTKNFQDTDTISASVVARYRGRFEQPLSIFYAQNDTENFIPLLSNARRPEIMEQAGISAKEVPGLSEENQDSNTNSLAQTENIPMDKSIFDIEAEQRKKSEFV